MDIFFSIAYRRFLDTKLAAPLGFQGFLVAVLYFCDDLFFDIVDGILDQLIILQWPDPFCHTVSIETAVLLSLNKTVLTVVH